MNNYIFWVRDIDGGWQDLATFSTLEKAEKYKERYLKENEPLIESCGVDEFEVLPHDIEYGN